MSGQERRAARRNRAHAEFAEFQPPPTPGFWPCPKDPGVFRLHDGVGWTEWTRDPAKQEQGSGPRGVRRSEPTGPGSAIERNQAERRELLHYVTDDDLRGIPEARSIDPHEEGRGWHSDPVAPDIGQLRFYTGTEWTDLVAITHRGDASYFRSTIEESRRRNDLWLEEQEHQPKLVLSETTTLVVVLLTAMACSLLVVAPVLPPGAGSDAAHFVGVIIGLAILFALCIAARNIVRAVPIEWRSSTLWVEYALAIPAFIALRGFRSVLSALGFG